MDENIAILDMDSIIYTSFHPNKKLDELGSPIRENNKFVYVEKTEEEVLESCDSLMHMVLRASKATHYIGWVKGKGTTLDRLKVNPDYKSNRGTEPPKYWKFCKDYFISKWGVIEANGAEVDDYVNVTRLKLPNAYIVAIDKDLLSLETKDKHHFNWRKNEWVEVSKEEAEYKFWCDVITGQSGDNIKGIPGKGIKFAEKLIEEVKNTNSGPLEGIILLQYINHFGEYKGIQEFYKNYVSLKILDEIESFELPKPIEYKRLDKEENNKLKIDF